MNTFPNFSNGFGINTTPGFAPGFAPNFVNGFTPGFAPGFNPWASGFSGFSGSIPTGFMGGANNGFGGFSPINSINPLAFGWNAASPFGMNGLNQSFTGMPGVMNGLNQSFTGVNGLGGFGSPYNTINPLAFGWNAVSPFGMNGLTSGFGGSPVNSWSNGYTPNFINNLGGIPTNGYPTSPINTSNLYGVPSQGVANPTVNGGPVNTGFNGVGTPYANTAAYSPFGVSPATCAHAA